MHCEGHRWELADNNGELTDNNNNNNTERRGELADNAEHRWGIGRAQHRSIGREFPGSGREVAENRQKQKRRSGIGRQLGRREQTQQRQKGSAAGAGCRMQGRAAEAQAKDETNDEGME
jgi:hypothetical protein